MLLEVRVEFHLVNGWGDVEVRYLLLPELWRHVGNPDGTDLTGLLGFLQDPPGFVNLAVWLVQEVEVDVVQTELLQGSIDPLLSLVVVEVGYPELGRYENVVTLNAALGDGLTHGFFVLVGGRRINQAVAGVQSVGNSLFGLAEVRNLEDPEAQGWHFNTVI